MMILISQFAHELFAIFFEKHVFRYVRYEISLLFVTISLYSLQNLVILITSMTNSLLSRYNFMYFGRILTIFQKFCPRLSSSNSVFYNVGEFK